MPIAPTVSPKCELFQIIFVFSKTRGRERSAQHEKAKTPVLEPDFWQSLLLHQPSRCLLLPEHDDANQSESHQFVAQRGVGTSALSVERHVG